MILLVAEILKRDLCYETQISFSLDCLRIMAGEHLEAINGVHSMKALLSIADEAAEMLRGSNTTPEGTSSYMPSPHTTALQQGSSIFAPTLFTTKNSGAWQQVGLATQFPAYPHVEPSWAESSDYAQTLGEGAQGDTFFLLQLDYEAFPKELTEVENLGMSGS